MNVAKLKKKFLGRELPEELINLCRFEENCLNVARISDNESLFSESFFIDFEDLSFFKDILESWSENRQFVNGFLVFGQATSTGSLYAFWDNGTGQKMDDMPILVIGDEGDLAIVAENMKDFMRLLTIDSEVFLEGNMASFFFQEEDDYTPSDFREDYLEWLETKYNMAPIESEDEAEELIKKAVDKYGESFKNWVTPFLDYDYVMGGDSDI